MHAAAEDPWRCPHAGRSEYIVGVRDMSLVHGLLDGEEREIEGGGVHQAKKLGPASSRGGTSKLGGVPEKLTLVPPALDSGPKWKGGSSGNNGRSSGSANRPRSVGPSRGKSKVREKAIMWYCCCCVVASMGVQVDLFERRKGQRLGNVSHYYVCSAT